MYTGVVGELLRLHFPVFEEDGLTPASGLVDGDFSMSSNTVIEISPGSSVEIFLGNGTFTMDANSLFSNLSQDPRNLAILGTADFHTMVLRSNSDFYGVVYVPEATVDYAANADLFGSVISNYFSMASNGGNPKPS